MKGELHLTATEIQGGTDLKINGNISFCSERDKMELMCALADCLNFDLTSVEVVGALMTYNWFRDKPQSFKCTEVRIPKV